jgi:dephospho-CoA kinase
MDQLEVIRGKDRRLLLGVTGGIASGKTTVANMLAELGAPIIDFDVIARRVVEPDKPAFKQIVEYFGNQVVQSDGTLDRKRLSDIVFQDFEKRKRLESFTHPRIQEEFIKELSDITNEDPDAIIQVVVPLLIELNMQYLFHKLLVVYISPEEQINRLAERDGIEKEAAANILKAQLPIDEKVGYADFVVTNDKSLGETRKQVEELWQNLKALQKERAPAAS